MQVIYHKLYPDAGSGDDCTDESHGYHAGFCYDRPPS